MKEDRKLPDTGRGKPSAAWPTAEPVRSVEVLPDHDGEPVRCSQVRGNAVVATVTRTFWSDRVSSAVPALPYCASSWQAWYASRSFLVIQASLKSPIIGYLAPPR